MAVFVARWRATRWSRRRLMCTRARTDYCRNPAGLLSPWLTPAISRSWTTSCRERSRLTSALVRAFQWPTFERCIQLEEVPNAQALKTLLHTPLHTVQDVHRLLDASAGRCCIYSALPTWPCPPSLHLSRPAAGLCCRVDARRRWTPMQDSPLLDRCYTAFGPSPQAATGQTPCLLVLCHVSAPASFRRAGPHVPVLLGGLYHGDGHP